MKLFLGFRQTYLEHEKVTFGMKFDCPGTSEYHILLTFLIWKNIDGAEGFNFPPSSICAKHDGIPFLGFYALKIEKTRV